MTPENSERLVTCIDIFNQVEPEGGLYELNFSNQNKIKKSDPLVEIIAYCINPNHFHLILKQIADHGISKFMMKVMGGYSWYFNKKNKRSGPLFQGPFRAKHITTNEHLVHGSAYVNLNDRVHQLSAQGAELVRSSWLEYTTNIQGICAKEIVLEQFDSKDDYRIFALDALTEMIRKRDDYAELKEILMNE